ncbi:flavodoxin FldB [Catenovulum sp. SM1970]|uniref:flavodoxin FldB n=1 Tax=Marinifaba aquimaris TaxID=2741323 RepID=UPI0015740A28|nr:flavodoxin FldB [Marinifaba aquimaris]NTS75450.1 flavodoxin FldB [Marinifaba aquimaris]
MKIGLFYGSTTCYTEMTAEKIQAFIGEDIVDIHNIKDVPLTDTAQYDLLIFGISTWDFGELQEDWESRWEQVSELDLNNKIVAIYGQGDQEDYGKWFQDAVGMLHEAISHNNCKRIGYWPVAGYEFEESKALTEDKAFFVGLSLDDENQYDLSEQRIETWCLQVLEEIAENS